MKEVIDPSAILEAPLRYFILSYLLFLGASVVADDLIFILFSSPFLQGGIRKYFFSFVFAAGFFIRARKRQRNRIAASSQESK